MTETRDHLIAAVVSLDSFASSFSWRTQFDTRKRALSEIDAAEAEMLTAYNDISQALIKANYYEAINAAVTNFRDGYIKRWRAYQAAGARTANWMVTGPARFNVERNRRRMEIERQRSEDLRRYVMSAVRNALNHAERAALRHKEAETDHDELHIGDVRIITNTVYNRLQLVFPTRPNPEIIVALKSRGFKWAPSQSAWQRQLTPNALNAFERSIRPLLEAA